MSNPVTEVMKRLAAQRDGAQSTGSRCRNCGTGADTKALLEAGGMCGPCFKAYCGQPKDEAPYRKSLLARELEAKRRRP